MTARMLLLFIPSAVLCLPHVISLCRSSGCSLWFMTLGSNCVYLQSHDLRMTPTGLNKEGREGHGLKRAHSHTFYILCCQSRCTPHFFDCDTNSVFYLLLLHYCFFTTEWVDPFSYLPNIDSRIKQHMYKKHQILASYFIGKWRP